MMLEMQTMAWDRQKKIILSIFPCYFIYIHNKFYKVKLQYVTCDQISYTCTIKFNIVYVLLFSPKG